MTDSTQNRPEAAGARAGGPGVLSMWVVTENPSDFPGLFVARRWEIARGSSMATADVVHSETLEGVRAQLPAWLTRIARDPRDDAVIVESWL